MITIVLARHCKTDWNAENRIQGQTDRDLNTEGMVQAQTLACAIRDDPALKIRSIVTSDLQRAVQTSKIVAEVLQLPPTSIQRDPRFRECRFGMLEGKTRFEIKVLLQTDLHTGNLSEYDFTEYGGENKETVLARQLEALRHHCGPPRTPLDGHVLVIGHGRSLGTLLHHFEQKYPLTQGLYQLLQVSSL